MREWIVFLDSPTMGFDYLRFIDKVIKDPIGDLSYVHIPKKEQSRPVAAKLRDTIPALEEKVKCPYCKDCNPLNLYYTIQHINDGHKKSREEIADWLDSLSLDLSFT